MKHARGLWITAAILGVFFVAVVVLIVVVTVAESGPKDYKVTEDHGTSDWSQISVPSEYTDEDYEAILDDARKGRWEDAGGYYVQIVCEADGEPVAKARGGVGNKGAARTGSEDGEWIVENSFSTGESACA